MSVHGQTGASGKKTSGSSFGNSQDASTAEKDKLELNSTPISFCLSTNNFGCPNLQPHACLHNNCSTYFSIVQ